MFERPCVKLMQINAVWHVTPTFEVADSARISKYFYNLISAKYCFTTRNANEEIAPHPYRPEPVGVQYFEPQKT